MDKGAADDFSEYIKVDMANELLPIQNSIDDMLMRLEEFESMVILVQQERGNVVGLTGSLSHVADNKDEMIALCNKIDVLETVVDNLKGTLDSLEDQIETIEEQSGYHDNSSLRNFFMPKMFKKTTENKTNANRGSVATFKTDDYFVSSEEPEGEEEEKKD